MIPSEIVVDESTHNKIIGLSGNLSGKYSTPVAYTLRNDVKSLVGEALKTFHAKSYTVYGDVFASQELIRFKFIVNQLHGDDVLQTILTKLETKFIIKEITYIDNMLIFWM